MSTAVRVREQTQMNSMKDTADQHADKQQSKVRGAQKIQLREKMTAKAMSEVAATLRDRQHPRIDTFKIPRNGNAREECRWRNDRRWLQWPTFCQKERRSKFHSVAHGVKAKKAQRPSVDCKVRK